MKEKLLIIFVASVLGLLITTIAFYIYQTTKPTDSEKTVENPVAKNEIKPTPEVLAGLVVEEPKNESVSDRRTIEVKGKADAGSAIIVSSNAEDVAGVTSTSGSFALNLDIDTGVNKIITRVISSSGEETIDTRIVTFTTEEF